MTTLKILLAIEYRSLKRYNYLTVLKFVQVNYEMDGKSYIVDDPMKKLSKETVQQEPMLKFEAASEKTMYEIVMINYDSEDNDQWLLWHVKGISGETFTKGKMMGDDMMTGKEYEGSILSCSI